jgi:hypothetical protein
MKSEKPSEVPIAIGRERPVFGCSPLFFSKRGVSEGRGEFVLAALAIKPIIKC